MHKLFKRYRHSDWYETFNLSTDGGKARSALLAAKIPQAIVGGFTGGIFYSGLLLGYGINIVNISILTTIPYLASLLTVFTPYILNHFKRRRLLISLTRILYYLINIVGITLLPVLVTDESARIWGLILITFLSNAINFLFEGYNPWHMPYIVPSVRDRFLTATTVVTNVSSSLVMLAVSAITDSVQGQARLTLITSLRYVAFGVALVNVYLMQIPKEPAYPATSDHPSLLDIFRRPLSDKSFRLTMLVIVGLQFVNCLSSACLNTWLLEEVQVSYLYVTVVDATYVLFVLTTSGFWSRCIRRTSCTGILSLSIGLESVAVLAYAFVNHSNYLWLMAAVRLSQHILAMGNSLALNAMLYENLPAKDQTAHLSFHLLATNLTTFLAMSAGTWIIAAMGEHTLALFGKTLTGVPVLLLIRGVLMIALTALILLLRQKIEPKRKFR